MKVKTLTKTVLNKELKQLPGWKINAASTTLYKTFMFKDHIDALVFIARVTVHAQVLQHHPEIIFNYKKVRLNLTTHEAKALTKKDIEFALRVKSIVSG